MILRNITRAIVLIDDTYLGMPPQEASYFSNFLEQILQSLYSEVTEYFTHSAAVSLVHKDD